MKREREPYENISTKVRASIKERIKRICQKKGINEYVMLQNMCDCIVRYMDDKHNLSPELERVMGIFEHLEGWKNAFNMADHTAEADICEAFYVMSAKGKKGYRVIHVERPWFDGITEWKQSENIQYILERFLEVATPEKYKKLRMLSGELAIESQLDLLDYMIEHHLRNSFDEFIRKEFEDAGRAENNKTLEYGQKTRSTHHHSPEEYIEQGVIYFEPDDTPRGFDGIPDGGEEEKE